MDITEKDETFVIPLAALNSKQIQFLSQISQDIRETVSHLSLPDVSPLSVLDATAIDCLKDLYYALNSEDPLNSMPVRRHVLTSNIPMECLVPIAVAADTDPAATRNRKRWSLPTYQTLRLFSVLTLPIAADSELPTPAQLDYLLLDLKFRIASHRKVLATFVSLLQYYIDRKSEKKAALVPAEESKVEDARIDNILRFFCNILSPPREKVSEAINERDRAVHLALVGSLVHIEFFSTLAVLFSTEEDSRSHYTDLIFLVADIYSLAYRHSSPSQMIMGLRRMKLDSTRNPSAKADYDLNNHTKRTGIVDELSTGAFDNQKSGGNSHGPSSSNQSLSTHSTGLRDALLRERATIGGSRAATVGSRWTSRHSGGFTKAIKSSEPGGGLISARNPNGLTNSTTKQILSAKGAVSVNKVFNSKHLIQDSVQINSDILCLQSSKRKTVKKNDTSKQALPTVRHDLQYDGLKGLVSLTTESIDISFQFFIREFRARIIETRERAQADEIDVLRNAEKDYLRIVGSVVGFHREKCGKVFKTSTKDADDSSMDSLSSLLHKIDMKSILSKDFKIVKTAWKEVEAAIELESFQMVFGILADAISHLREATSRDRQKINLIELATFSVLEMMKMLQGMAVNVSKEIEEAEMGKQGELTPRELALNTIEDLFERESFLNAPADLAKMFTTKVFSFQHLRNIIELVHTFTTILLDEEELAKITVAKKKRPPRRKQPVQEKDFEPKLNDKDAATSITNGTTENLNKGGNGTNDLPKNVDVELTSKPDGSEKIPDETENSKTSDTARELESAPEKGESVESKGIGDLAHKDGSIRNDQTATIHTEITREPTEVEKMLRADEADLNNNQKEKPVMVTKKLTEVEKMLKADEEDLNKIVKDKSSAVKMKQASTVEEMLRADEQAAVKGVPQPKYVTSLDGNAVDAKAIVEAQVAGIADEEDGEEDDYEQLTEIESIGIVRRFANIKAIETLLIPLRAAMCEASELTGKVFSKPDGSEAVVGPTVVAKSASVIWSIWKVARLLERGALCGSFFSFSVLQFLGIALNAVRERRNISEKSIIAHVAGVGREITEVFIKWLTVNPGLMYDMFLVMDKAYAVSFARKVNKDEAPKRQKRVAVRGPKSSRRTSNDGSKTRGNDKNDKDDKNDQEAKVPSSPDMWDSDELEGLVDYSGKDSSLKPKSLQDSDEEEMDSGDNVEFGSRKMSGEGSKKRKGSNDAKVNSRRKRRRQKRANGGMSEDEDIDDFDALQFGHEAERSERSVDHPVKGTSPSKTRHGEDVHLDKRDK